MTRDFVTIRPKFFIREEKSVQFFKERGMRSAKNVSKSAVTNLEGLTEEKSCLATKKTCKKSDKNRKNEVKEILSATRSFHSFLQ